jgi:hypothetical protein
VRAAYHSPQHLPSARTSRLTQVDGNPAAPDRHVAPVGDRASGPPRLRSDVRLVTVCQLAKGVHLTVELTDVRPSPVGQVPALPEHLCRRGLGRSRRPRGS